MATLLAEGKSDNIFSALDVALGKARPSRIVVGTAAVVISAQILHKLITPLQYKKRIVAVINRAIRIIFKKMIDVKLGEFQRDIKFPKMADEVVHDTLPEKGMNGKDVIALAATLQENLNCDHRKGELSGMVYSIEEEHTKFVNKIMEMYQWSNPLHPDAFGACRKMEAEIVAMVLSMYNGHTRPGACGSVTSGGTESILMAVKSHRDWGASRGIKEPEVVMPITAHPAFDKACFYFKIKLIKVAVDPETQKAVPHEMEKHITRNTVLIVGSAPCFPSGTIDPLDEISEIALRHDIGFHVDSCLGGFTVPFMERAGEKNVPICDFRLPGVTSISADTHKFGLAPKGSSVVMYATKELRRFQYFAIADWPGGVYASPAMSGSKAGNIVAGCWATLLRHGWDGYVDATKKVMYARRTLVDGIKANPHLKVIGTPTVNAVGFTAVDLDIYVLNEKLTKEGYHLNPLQFPCGIQFNLTLVHGQKGIMDRFVEVLNKCTAEMVAAGETSTDPTHGATMYGAQQKVSDRSILDDLCRLWVDGFYETKV